MIEAMEEAFKDGKDTISNIADYVEAVKDDINDILDDIERISELYNEQFDEVNDHYDYLLDMNELIFGEKAYAEQEKIHLARAHANEEYLKALEKQRITAKNTAESLYDASKDQYNQSESYYQALEHEKEIDEQILDTRQEIVESYKDAKQAANELAIQN